MTIALFGLDGDLSWILLSELGSLGNVGVTDMEGWMAIYKVGVVDAARFDLSSMDGDCFMGHF